MTTEMLVLTFSIALGFAQLFWAAMATTQERGVKWNLSPRDGTPPPLSAKTARIDRAFQNFKETFPFFATAVLLVIASNRAGTLSHYGVWTYFLARILYIPLLVMGIPGIRSVVWMASCIGIVLVLVQAYLG